MHAGEPTLRRWSVDEYHQMANLGWFNEQRVELIGGEVMVSPRPTDLHETIVNLAAGVLGRVFGPGHCVRTQKPLRFGESSEAVPDIAIVKGPAEDLAGRDHPTSALLVVEVSDVTLKYDCGEKASLYAAHGIKDYWVLNLVDRCLEVRRHAVGDPSQRFRFHYQTLNTSTAGQGAIPLAMRSAMILVADLLP